MERICEFEYRGVKCGIEIQRGVCFDEKHHFWISKSGVYNLMKLPANAGVKRMKKWIDENMF